MIKIPAPQLLILLSMMLFIPDVSPFGAIYDRDELEEGDTPAFLHVVNTGLRSHEHPAWGGWGGRFQHTGPGNLWIDAEDDGDNTKPLWRFIAPIQDDFAARMQWAVTSRYEDANHAPVVKLAHPEKLTVKAGSVVELDASPTYDPDGDEIWFDWSVYTDAGTYPGFIQISDFASEKAEVHIPADASGSVIHVICEVRDAVKFSMNRYRRVILTVE